MSDEKSIEMREATTRYINITCKSRETGQAFDLTGYTVQTYLQFGKIGQYINNTVVENLVSYKIPATASFGARSGIAETRIFKDGDVYEIFRINIAVKKANKPDTEPNE